MFVVTAILPSSGVKVYGPYFNENQAEKAASTIRGHQLPQSESLRIQTFVNMVEPYGISDPNSLQELYDFIPGDWSLEKDSDGQIILFTSLKEVENEKLVPYEEDE